MKRVLFALLALLLVLPLVACGDVKVIDKGGNDAVKVPTDPAGSTAGYLFKNGDATVAVDEMMSAVLTDLGEPKQYYEAASCAFNGLDKMYTYEHFEVDSYPAPDGDRVQSIFLMDDLVATAEGLRIGDSRAKAEELYGTDCEVVGTESIYTKGGMKLKVMMENDVVTYITYLSCAADFDE